MAAHPFRDDGQPDPGRQPVLGGLLLCTDYVLLRMVGFVLSAALLGPARAAKLLPGRRKAEAAKNSQDEGEDEVLDEFDEVVSVRFRGRQASDVAEDELGPVAGESEPLPAEDEEPADEELQKRPPALKRLLAGRTEPEESSGELRIRKPTDRNEREAVMQCLDEASRGAEHLDYVLPSLDLLLPSDGFNFEEQEKEVRRKAKVLEKTFADFGFKVRVVEIETGPVVRSTRWNWRPVCGCPRSPPWPMTWPSPCGFPACGLWPRFPARTRSEWKSPTTSAR